MRFLQNIIGKTSGPKPVRRTPVDLDAVEYDAAAPAAPPEFERPKFSRRPTRVTRPPVDPSTTDEAFSEILAKWKKDVQPASTDEDEMTPATPKAPARRAKTRLLGFDSTMLPDPFENTKPSVDPESTRFPVGWLVITDGPGRGASFTLLTGMSQIGRGADQTVALDFGDEAISRQNHAAVVYDLETHSFLMGHGGKANVVRVNDAPLISNQPLAHGDRIRLGETTLQLVVFSTPEFNWAGPSVLEADDVAQT